MGKIKPDIYIMSKSSGRKPSQRGNHFDIMRSIGGRVIVEEDFHNVHSTEIIDRMKKAKFDFITKKDY
jgi:hypothetical protein